MDVARWRQPRLVARIWWCGDEVCDCTQPVIELVVPDREAGHPRIRRAELWTGKFLTGTYGYTPEERGRLQYEPLREECHRFGIPVPKDLILRLAGPVAPLP